MESSPAPGSLWFLSPAGKELVRPQTHETPSSSTPNPVRVPPLLIPLFSSLFSLPNFSCFYFFSPFPPKTTKKEKLKDLSSKLLYLDSGNVLLSRAVSSQVPSALKGLTSVFGMGTGGTPSPSSPEIVNFSFSELPETFQLLFRSVSSHPDNCTAFLRSELP